MFKKYSIIVIFLISMGAIAQTAAESYKYALMPAKFKFQNEKNEYRLNSTLKLFFANKGFEVYMDDEQLPEELANNKCKAIFVNVEPKNTMFTTKLKVVVKDCNDKVLVISDEGSSREKEFKVAYNQVLLIALKSIQNASFKVASKTNEPEKVIAQVVQNTTITTINSATFNVLTIDNGFNLINKSTNAIITLLKTTNASTYIARLEEKNGIVFKKGEQWYFEYYQNGKLVSEILDIKL